jgi:acyl-coenzyme A thioesterase PaaI-like protein
VAATPDLTNFACEPDADYPGWLRWRIVDASRFNEAVLGPQRVRRESESHCRIRMMPQVPLHTNSAGNVHGAITLSFIDVSLFAALYVLRGLDAGRSVTLDLTSQFIGAGDAARPLDSVVELLRETRRLAFLRGLVVQDEDLVASFTATVRKPSAA